MATYSEEKKTTTREKLHNYKSLERQKEETNKNKMEGQCKETPGVEEAEGGRCDRQEQMATTRTFSVDPVRKMAIEE